jgi:hypothetical protein
MAEFVSQILPARRRHPKWMFPRGSVLLGQSSSGADVLVDSDAIRKHVHVVGASGYGKSKLLENVARQGILALDGQPKGLILIDPHGTVVQAILRWLTTHGVDRYRRIHVVDPTGEDIVGINPFQHRPGVDAAFSANTFCNAVMEVWGGADPTQTPQLRESIKGIFYTLTILGWTLLECELLTDIADPLGVRQFIVDNVRHPQIRRFWATLNALPPAKIEEKLGSAVRRLNEFLLPQALRRIFSRRDRVIDFRAAMDAGDIILIDLSYGNGRISEDESSLLGRLILADIFLSCLGRAEGSTETLVIVDECQRYLTRDIASILDQARKFGLSLVLAHQHLGHLREAGEHIFRSVMTNTRTKVIFGGLDDDDATVMARNIFRGTLDLEFPKRTFDKPTVIGQDYDWLCSAAVAHGTAHAEGTNWSEGESLAHSESLTASWARAISDSDTTSKSRTRSDATTDSAARARSRSAGDQWSHTENRADGTAASETRSTSSGESMGVNQEYSPYRTRASRLTSPAPGAAVTDGFSDTKGLASTRGQSSSSGSADSYGGASMQGETYLRSSGTTLGRADTIGIAHTSGVVVTEGVALTEGTTHTRNWSIGGNVTETASRSDTRGRGQTLRSVFATLPTQAYTLEELRYYASSLLGGLGIGEAIAKIGDRPPVRLNTLPIKPGWANKAQVERLRRRLAAASPFITPLPEARSSYLAWRQELMGQLLGVTHQPAAQVDHPAGDPDEPCPEAPPLKDQGWG